MSNLDTLNPITGAEVAIIGMAGRFPGAENIDEFWDNLKKGIESLSFLADEELKKAGVTPELIEQDDYVKAKGGVLENKDLFDASFFGYSPKEAELMNPHMRIFHECAVEALENSGYNWESYHGSIGIYGGAGNSTFWEGLSLLSGKSDEVGKFAANYLVDNNALNSRISYKLNLRGPSVTLQTACSTSLVAVHFACQALLNGECDMALAGGITLVYKDNIGYLYQEGMLFSRDGHCRAFDAGANGIVGGEGTAIVVLKLLEEAIADKDNIYAVIKGTAVNNDGARRMGYTAPSADGQAEVIRAAIKMAEVEPESIGYIEAHGTGTIVGDPIEITGLQLAFATERKGFCSIGSVKTNIGHLDRAAGVTGLIKAALSLKHKLIPPSLNFSTPNPDIDFENSPFVVNRTLKEWKRNSPNQPLRAGVSSFGIGGTNAHTVLEEPPPLPPSSPSREYSLILLSARTGTALEQATKNLVDHLKRNPNINLADAAYTLQVGRLVYSHRRMLVCSNSDVKEAVDFLSSPGPRKVKSHYGGQDKPLIVFMFTGLGAQYVNMGRDLYEKEPIFRQEMDRCFGILNTLMDENVKEILYPGSGIKQQLSGNSQCKNQSEAINQPGISQMVIFIFEYSLAKLLFHWGIYPWALIGYSFGEYTAACLAGVFSVEDALTLIAARGKLITQLPEGLMVSVPLPASELQPLMKDKISLAIDNGPSCVVSGLREVVEAFEKEMKEKRIVCMRLQNTSRALHSKAMEPVLTEFEKILRGITLNKPKIPFISNVTGNWVTPDEITSFKYWSAHLVGTVQFADGINRLIKETTTIFLEIGPGRDLSSLITRYIENNPHQLALNLVRPPQKKVSDIYFLINKIGYLWLYGTKIDWEKFYSGENRYRLSLPTYPFERQSFWIEGDLFKMGAGQLKKSLLVKKQDIADWFNLPSWKPSILPFKQSGEIPRFFNWLVFMDECGLGQELEKKLESAGQQVIIVKPAGEFKKESAQAYRVNPKNIHDYKNLINELNELHFHPQKIVHLWSVTEYDPTESREEWVQKCQDLGYYSLIFLTQAIENQNMREEIQITVITNNMQGVYGEELLYPEKATLLGPVNIIPQEYPTLKCRTVDVVLPEAGSSKSKKLVSQLLEELNAEVSDVFIAYRGSHRLVRAYEPIRLDKPISSLRLREGGKYLITGGLGDIGLLLAKHLANRVKARLILTGRSPFPPRDQWEQYLVTNHTHEDDNIALKIKTLKEVEALGGEVLVLSADVSHRQRMEEVVHLAEKQFGPINGVIHTALQIDGGLIHSITPKEIENVFTSKVRGTLVLDQIFKKSQLDFFVLFSSVASILGGVGHAAYAGASAFLDAFALYRSSNDPGFTVSINWDGWQEVGGALRLFKERGKALGFSDSQLKMEEGIKSLEGMEAFNRIIECPVPRIVVCTQDLNERIKHSDLSISRESFHKMTLQKKRYQRPQLDTEYAAASNAVEKVLVDIWSKFFGFEPVGIHDDFFDLGGDSLKAIIITSIIHQELDIKISIATIFSKPTIKELAGFIEDSKNDKPYSSIPFAEKKEYYILSSAQKRLYILQQMKEDSIAYNESQAILMEGKLDRSKLEGAFRKLLQRHEMLRTSVELVEHKPVQRVYESIKFEIEYSKIGDKDFKTAMKNFVRPFALNQAPFLRVRVVEIGEEKHILMIDMHQKCFII